MASVLLAVWPFPTHLHPFLALAHALRDRGHEVVFYTGAHAAEDVAGEGFRCAPFRDVAWSRVREVVCELIDCGNPARIGSLWTRFLVDTIPPQLKDLEGLLDEWQPAALVCDIAMLAPQLILHQTRRIPVAAFSHVAISYLPGPDGPIPGIALPRARTWLVRSFAYLAAKLVTAATARVRAKAGRLRIEHGLPPLTVTIPELTATMRLLLIPGAPELDGDRTDLPRSVHYVGPCLWDKSVREPPAQWVQDLPQGSHFILVEEDSLYVRNPRILKLAAKALAGFPERVVLVAGNGRNPGELHLRPSGNLSVRPYTPLSELLPFVDVLVTNGNSESVVAALVAGIPLVVLPSLWDQAEISWRVQEAGAGLRLDPQWCSKARLREAVKRVRCDPSFRAQARRLGAALLRLGGPPRAAELVESIMDREG